VQLSFVHTSFAPPQFVAVRHCTHWPAVVSQYGVGALHTELSTHSEQRCVVGLQSGRLRNAVQFVSPRHWTQFWFTVSQ
jgi:hypothetical protein